MSKLKHTLKDKKLYIFLIITIMFFGIFSRMNYSTDTYCILDTNPENIVGNFLSSGRFVTALWFKIVSFLRIDISIISLTSYIIAIVCITLSLYKLYNIIKENVKSEVLEILLSTIIIINPFSVEFFMFIERGILAFAILMCICAVEIYIKFLQEKNNVLSIFLSLIYMLIATFSYQGVLAIYIALSAIYTIKYSKGIKKFAKNTVLMFICYGIPALLNLITVRLFFSNTRVSGNIDFSQSLEKIKLGMDSMFATYGILPEGLFIMLIMIVTILLIITIIIKKDMIKNKILSIISYIYVYIITIIMSILPVIMQNTESIWFVPRSTYAFSSLVGILILTIIICTVEDSGELKTIKIGNIEIKDLIISTMTVISVILLIVELKRFNTIGLDYYKTNYLDKVNSTQIGQMIQEYEKQTGEKITKISIYQDEYKLYAYEGIFSSGDINITGFSTDWSDVSMINYYNNIKLEKVEIDQEIEAKFKGKNWNNFDREQIIFKGNTIHYCKF